MVKKIRKQTKSDEDEYKKDCKSKDKKKRNKKNKSLKDEYDDFIVNSSQTM